MKLSNNKLFLIFFTLAALALIAWSFPILKNRYFTKPAAENVAPEISTEPAPAAVDQNAADSADTDPEITDENSDEPADTADDNTDVAVEEDNFLEVLPEDCKNNCDQFDQPEDLQYCREYCGLNTVKKNPAGCDKFADLEKDYCLKNQALEKSDSKICTQISDSGIKRSCINRLTEDIINTPTAQ